MINKIFNFQFAIFNKKAQQGGFTLVEILASVIVLTAVGSIITGIISSSLRGAGKANTIENIRQNGNYALAQMSKDIEYAQSFDGKNTGLSNDNGVTYDVNCILSLSPTPTPVTNYSLITVQSANNIRTKYRCSTSPSVLSAEGISPVGQETSLVDLSSVRIQSCSFTCTQNKPTDVPLIGIKFTLIPNNSSGLVENVTSLTFETSVVLRSYRK